ncbi:thiamine biosynthesis protein [Salmonella enterica subsp. enterica]|uniref:Thiamine biosynthesis protein n=1 Tax=Salmonella enterica I TaxID=59201 RepID=A0A447N7M0_SALET|nr:thiamine biosynthesis protein [Salmonella enterica subsp. enterica]
MKMTFCRAVCLAAAFLLMGCDEAPETTTASPAAQVLEGKTMGTLWRVSVGWYRCETRRRVTD